MLEINISSFIPLVRCPDLPAPRDGSVDLSGNEVGATATYSCDAGFQLVGPKERICGENGSWSPNLEPKCREIDRGELIFMSDARD